MEKHIRTEQGDGGVALLYIDRPEKLNALAFDTRIAIAEKLEELERNEAVRAVVLTGSGKAFCAGQDIAEAVDDTDGKGISQNGYIVLNALRHCETPLVSALNGAAMGAGMQLGILADYALMADSAVMSMSELKVGVPCVLGSCVLTYMLGSRKAYEYILTCKKISADEALSVGLVNEVCTRDKLLDRAVEMAELLASMPPVSYKYTKAFLAELTDGMFASTFEAGRRAFIGAYASGEPKEYMGRFLKKS